MAELNINVVADISHHYQDSEDIGLELYGVPTPSGPKHYKTRTYQEPARLISGTRTQRVSN